MLLVHFHRDTAFSPVCEGRDKGNILVQKIRFLQCVLTNVIVSCPNRALHSFGITSKSVFAVPLHKKICSGSNLSITSESFTLMARALNCG